MQNTASHVQLIEALKHSSTPEQKQNVANILRGNPEMMAFFLRMQKEGGGGGVGGIRAGMPGGQGTS